MQSHECSLAEKFELPVEANGDRKHYDTFFLSPLQIHFTLDSIAAKFRPFQDQNKKVHDKHLLDTVQEMLRSQASLGTVRWPQRVCYGWTCKTTVPCCILAV